MKPIRFEHSGNWLDKAIGYVAPEWGAKRIKARMAMSVRAFEGASSAQRLQHWLTAGSAARVETERDVAALRNRSRDLVRNNPYAAKAIDVIVNHTIGRGIRAQFRQRQSETVAGTASTGTDSAITQMELDYRAWAETTACDADGINNIYGLQRLIMRTVAESGSCLIRKVRAPRRQANSSANLPPLALQVLEPDFLDRLKDGPKQSGYVSHGKEYDNAGQLKGYWVYEYHPGDGRGTPASEFYNATEIAHVYRLNRPGQTDGIPWLSTVAITLKDFDEFEDAFLFRQKIANCHAAFIYDSNPDAAYDTSIAETLEPGVVEILPPGKDIKFNDPPKADGSETFRRSALMKFTAGMGVSYESVTGDYSHVNFSSGRMGHIEMASNVAGWQYHMIIPMAMDRIAAWYLEAQGVAGADSGDVFVQWIPPRREMVDPSKEIPPIREAIRSGLMTPQAGIRQMGFDPDEVLEDWSAFAEQLDSRGLMLDIDPRRSTINGTQVANTEEALNAE